MTTIVTLKITILKKNQKGNKGKSELVQVRCAVRVAQNIKDHKNNNHKDNHSHNRDHQDDHRNHKHEDGNDGFKLTMVKETWSSGILLPLIALLLILATCYLYWNVFKQR